MLGAFFQCYKQPYATYKCLESFRNIYPTEPIVLLSSNGHDYTNMATHFRCIYLHEDENISFIQERNEQATCIRLIQRVVKAFSILQCEYVLWLEDDVHVHKPLPKTFAHDLNGFAPNCFSPQTITQLQNYGLDPRKTYRWTGHGGSVYNRRAFLHAMEQTDIVQHILTKWDTLHLSSNICQDMLFSLILLCNRGTTGPYEGHIDSEQLDTYCVVQHQYKAFYNVPLPSDVATLISFR
jgi:hypothetical protein